jgi:hypothetical protein
MRLPWDVQAIAHTILQTDAKLPVQGNWQVRISGKEQGKVIIYERHTTT